MLLSFSQFVHHRDKHTAHLTRKALCLMKQFYRTEAQGFGNHKLRLEFTV